MRAMPSPTCRTVPTSARSVSTSYCSIRERRIDVISSGRSFISAPHQFMSQSFESSAHARVRAIRPGLEDEAPDQRRVDAARRLHLPSCRLLDLSDDLARLGVGQLACGDQVDRQPALLTRHEPLELACDLLDLARASLLCHELQEVREELVLRAGEIGEDARLRRRLELRVLQDRAQLRGLLDRAREVGEVLVDLRELVLVLRCFEQRLGIDAVRGGYRASSRRLKSSEPMASLISSRSRSASSLRPTTIDVASSVRSATSERICSSARDVSAAISRRVSSSRRWRSASVSSRMRVSIASRVLRASAMICSASPRASCISLRCSSSRLRASWRALSASSIDRRICSRRSSIIVWIGPNAYFLSTKNVMKNATIVQIIRPGVTWMRALDASIRAT